MVPAEPDLSEILLNWFSVVYYLLASLAIGSAAFWAFFKTKIFRDFKPSLNLELQIEDRKIADGKTYLLVLLRMTNTSRVQVDFGHSVCSLHRIYRLDEDKLGRFQQDIRGKKTGAMFPWTYLDPSNSLREKELTKGLCVIEPQASEQQFFEFIIDEDECLPILVKCFVYDRSTEDGNDPIVWPVQKIHQLGG